MKISSLLPMTLLLAAALAPAQDIAGDWHGSVDVKNDAPLRLVLHISRNKPLKATLDSIDEGGMGLPVDTIAINGSALKFEMKSIGGTYEGKIAPDGSRITGSWSQDGGVWPLIWERGKDPAGTTQRIEEQEAKTKGRIYTRWFYEGKLDDLWAKLSPVLQQALGSKGKLNDLRNQILQHLGSETELTAENVRPDGALQVYKRLAKFEKVEGNVEVQFAFDPKGSVAGIYVRPTQRE
jgi:hypothetical protein